MQQGLAPVGHKTAPDGDFRIAVREVKCLMGAQAGMVEGQALVVFQV